jgi:hypothetical protein
MKGGAGQVWRRSIVGDDDIFSLKQLPEVLAD